MEHLCDKAFNEKKIQKHNEWSLNNFYSKTQKRQKRIQNHERIVLVGKSTNIWSNSTILKISINYQDKRMNLTEIEKMMKKIYGMKDPFQE